MSSVFNDFGSNIAKRASERDKLLVRGVKEFGSMKKMKEQRGRKWIGDSHAKVNNDNITIRVLGVVEDVFGSMIWVKRQRERGNQAYFRGLSGQCYGGGGSQWHQE